MDSKINELEKLFAQQLSVPDFVFSFKFFAIPPTLSFIAKCLENNL